MDMTSPTYPRKSRKRLYVALCILGLGILLLCCAGILNAATGDKSEALDTPAAAATSKSAKAKPKATPTPVLKVGDVTLKAKIKSKECFGSAGCNLVYTIDASVKSYALIPDECEVTYEVKGFDDGAQIHTLTMRDDGVYEQDGFQSGSTSSSSKKLAAKATDVTCR